MTLVLNMLIAMEFNTNSIYVHNTLSSFFKGNFTFSFGLLGSELLIAVKAVQKEDKLAAHIITSVRYSTDQTWPTHPVTCCTHSRIATQTGKRQNNLYIEPDKTKFYSGIVSWSSFHFTSFHFIFFYFNTVAYILYFVNKTINFYLQENTISFLHCLISHCLQCVACHFFVIACEIDLIFLCE